MDCLNRLEIQQYIDNEVSDEAKTSFSEHMQNCEQCRTLWEIAKKETWETQELISLSLENDDRMPIRAFIHAKRKVRYNKWLRFSSIAAGVLLILCIYQYRSIMNEKNARYARAKMEAERNLYESDLNKLWNDKQSIITIIDADGNLIYMNN